MKQKPLRDIKFGDDVLNCMFEPRPVTYDLILRVTGLAPKQVQKALADLCKYGYAAKVATGYTRWSTNG